ncbi:HD-GYP domain-containing protein [Allonocardiopsis opalescens]|uniref:HD domain-containing protein n=1 Tax=Allonocardiopsis opalescens TaxID=1144618 RepID=A0A2T0QDP7_9ACTN|nr:HD domain-containing phosphohydrolase [Allonocardiopsis opalescens]PRY02049.1 HD domain-containing protein [Allonocardiopsis opalescens]
MNRSSAPRWALQRIDTGTLLLAAAALVVVAVSLSATAMAGLRDPATAFGFGVLVAVGELTRMTLPGNREVAPISSAGALGYTFVLTVAGVPAVHSATQVISVCALATLLGALPHLVVNRGPHLDAVARRLLVVALVAVVYRPFLEWARPLEHHVWVAIAAMAVLATLVWLADCVIAAGLRADALRARFGVTVRDELRAQAPIGVAVATSGVLLALSASVMGLIALVVFSAPLLVTHVAFRRYAEIRLTYAQTVRALSRVTEVGGYVENGHSRRVSQLAVMVGRDLGLREAELLDLEYAALMHDIGQLSLPRPIPGGATVLAAREEQVRIAELGASVIQQTGVLDRVAEMVRRQSDPAAGRAEDGPPPLGSRIIKAANAFDDLVGGSRDRDRAAAVIERLRLDSRCEYDPRVIEALERVHDRPPRRV